LKWKKEDWKQFIYSSLIRDHSTTSLNTSFMEIYAAALNEATRYMLHYHTYLTRSGSWNSLIGLATEGSEFEFLLHIIQTGSGAHPTSYPVGTGNSFPGDKAAGA
jgi:hypothetical protein